MIIKALSWNIHKCVGNDQKRCSTRILSTIKEISPDIAILQEVDRKVGRKRATLPINDLEHLSGMRAVLSEACPNRSIGWRGNLLLVKPGIVCLKQTNISLPSLEPRGAVIWELEKNGISFDAIGMHLGLLGINRRRQVGAIASAIAMKAPIPTIVAGDSNDWWWKSMELSVLEDVLGSQAIKLKTFPSKKPIFALDKTLAGRGAHIEDQQVIRNIAASDHLPLLTEIRIGEVS